MNFLPMEIETIIIDYKNQLETKQEKERTLLSNINNLKHLNINVRKEIYIPIIKLYNSFNNFHHNHTEHIHYKGYHKDDLNYITEDILYEYNILFKWRNPAKRHMEIRIKNVKTDY